MRLSASFQNALQEDNYRKVLIFILIAFAIVLFAGVGLRSPWPADEPRFAEAAREMVASGHWFFPLRGGELYPDKPPVFMWSIAIFYALLGNMKLAFMLPNIFCSLAVVWCVFDLAAKFWNVRVASFASVGLLIAPQFILQAKSAQIDAMLATWVTISMYALLRHFFVRTNWKLYYLGWAFMGLGIITKGVGFLPIFLLIPILFLHFSKRYDFGRSVSWQLWLGPLALLAVVACWLVPMMYIADSSANADFIAYKENILFHQTMNRYAHSWTHLQPWYYFLLHFPLLWFPLPWLLLNKTFWKKCCDVKIATLLIWCVLVIVFFSSTPGKRGVYILPALPMFALAVAPYMAQYQWARWFRYLTKALIVFVCLVLMLAGVLLLIHYPALLKLAARKSSGMEDVLPLVNSFGWMLLIAGGIAGGLFIWSRRQSAVYQLAIVSFWGWLWFSLAGYPLLNPLRTAAGPIMHEASHLIGPEGELALVDFKEQFLLASPISLTQFSYLAPRDEQLENAWLWMQEKPHRFILVPALSGEKNHCFDFSKGVDLGRGYRKTWWLLGEKALGKQCPKPEQIKRYHMVK